MHVHQSHMLIVIWTCQIDEVQCDRCGDREHLASYSSNDVWVVSLSHRLHEDFRKHLKHM